MPDTPTFGRYAEIPYDRMTPEQHDAYRLLIETRGRLPGPNKIWVHNPKLAKVMGPLGVQLIGPRFRDETLLDCAAWVMPRLGGG